MNQQNGHSNGFNGTSTPQTPVAHTVGLYDSAYSVASHLAAKTGASLSAICSRAVEQYAQSLSQKEINSLSLESKIAEQQKRLAQLIGQRNGVQHHKQKSGKRKYTKRDRSYWAKDGGHRV